MVSTGGRAVDGGPARDRRHPGLTDAGRTVAVATEGAARQAPVRGRLSASIAGVLDRSPVILDVDTGIDDSLALLYAVASPEADIVAVTCVSGNIEAEQVGINTRAILELAGRAGRRGRAGPPVPLVRPLETTPETHGPQGLGYAELPPPSRPLSDRHAVDLHRRRGPRAGPARSRW